MRDDPSHWNWISLSTLAGTVTMSQPNFVLRPTSPVDPGVAGKVLRCLRQAREEVAGAFYGSPHPVDDALTALVAGGHILVRGATGTGKTTLATALQHVLNLNSSAITCTLDLHLGDLFADPSGGTSISSPSGGGTVRLPARPIASSQFLILDEIDSAPPRLRAALAQLVGKNSLTLSGKPYQAPSPFHLFAALTPRNGYSEITVQLDGFFDLFLFQIDLPPLCPDDERRIILDEARPSSRKPLYRRMNPPDLLVAQQLAQELPFDERLIDTIQRLIALTNPQTSPIESVRKYVANKVSIRAAQGLVTGSRARALIQGRPAPTVDDIIAIAPSVLRHRLAPTFEAQADAVDMEAILQELCTAL